MGGMYPKAFGKLIFPSSTRLEGLGPGRNIAWDHLSVKIGLNRKILFEIDKVSFGWI